MTSPSSMLGAELSDEDCRSLLEANQHGVLSMGVEDRGYGVPMSYEFEDANDRLLLGFVNTPGSKKAQFATKSTEVTFSVYHFRDVDTWESVVVTGPLERVPDAAVSRDLTSLFFFPEQGHEDGELLNLDDFERSWYELRITDVTGRHSGL